MEDDLNIWLLLMGMFCGLLRRTVLLVTDDGDDECLSFHPST